MRNCAAPPRAPATFVDTDFIDTPAPMKTTA
jgi:hypothetical protein